MEKNFNNFIEKRRQICYSCDKLKNVAGLRVCGVCSCSIWLKTKIKNECCPIKKWTQETNL